jgi:hypothetical protein
MADPAKEQLAKAIADTQLQLNKAPGPEKKKVGSLLVYSHFSAHLIS